MTFRRSDIIQTVCDFPNLFRNGQKSAVQLAKSLRLRARRAEITQPALAAFLKDHPEQIELWLGWSDDKRTSPAWGLRRTDTGYLLFRYPDGPRTSYENGPEACAAFIEKEIDGLLSSL
ncbi:MAG: hypothetical protein HKO95_00165 [Rhodobacteraceae bacterium]|nr:hypothetical protein [Alphaproteobacteria bacterium]MBT8474731.1 hypothetical protein [Alphaproteobacteria bacterium]NNF71169.1 hypothetical protein [Paracoccaceae bacterium]NNK65128.1 hypothetical protein [Paracoccaceae bacterium]